MTIREQIIEQLNVNTQGTKNYDLLKRCVTLEPYERKGVDFMDLVTFCPDSVDLWFRGVIQSLFYKPNNYILVLEGDVKQSWLFFEEIFWKNGLYSTDKRSLDVIYHRLINNFEFEYQKEQDWAEQDNFRILEENCQKLIYPGTDKRLCSYCTTTTEWRYPQRKNVIVLPVESINWEIYNSIDKLKLWQEIFAKFK